MFSMMQCLIIYVVVCGLLSLVCLILFDEIPWPGYILTAVPLAAVICYNEGFMTAFLVLAIINCITMIPYIFATLVNFIKLIIPAAAETTTRVIGERFVVRLRTSTTAAMRIVGRSRSDFFAIL